MRPLLVSLITVLAVAGCGSSEDPAAPSTGSTLEAQGNAGVVQIRDFKFLPQDVTVEAGTEVRWSNADAAPHTATADDGSFDTGNLRKGDTASVTLRKRGSFTYFCEFHKFMRATITVR